MPDCKIHWRHGNKNNKRPFILVFDLKRQIFLCFYISCTRGSLILRGAALQQQLSLPWCVCFSDAMELKAVPLLLAVSKARTTTGSRRRFSLTVTLPALRPVGRMALVWPCFAQTIPSTLKGSA